jgi:hypothetical protein
MRSFVAVALTCLALSPVAFSQTPSVPGSNVGPATQAPGAQTPGAQTPAPQTPAAPASAMTPKGAEDQLFVELKAGYNNVKITPDTRGPDGRPDRSFLTPGDNAVLDLTYFQDHGFGGSNRIQVLGIFRNTDDFRVDPERSSFQRGYIRFTTPNWEWNFGDYLVNYSRFTYNQNIKGVHMKYKGGDHFTLMANSGVFTDRWGSIFKDDLFGKPFTRVVAGLRAEARINKDSAFGFNFSHGRDLSNSIRRDLQAGFLAANNQIISWDARVAIGKSLLIDGEVAYSWTNPDTARLRTKQEDWGARLDTSFREGPFFLRTSYTRLLPDFLSVNARQLADLQDSGVRGGVDLGPHVTVEGSYRHTNNNLRSNRPEGTTTFKVPEGRISLRQLPGFGRTIMDFGYRERKQEGPFRTNINAFEDRVTRIPFVELSVPLGSTLFGFGYEHRKNEDRRQPSLNTDTNRFSASLRSIFDLGGWQVSPMFRYEIEREEFFRVFGFNNNRNIQAALFVEAPKYFTFDFTYRQIGASLFSECVTTATDNCSPALRGLAPGLIVLLPSGFGRPAYHGAITYKIRNDDNRQIVFYVDHNNNIFAIANRDFRERVIGVTFLYRFKK